MVYYYYYKNKTFLNETVFHILFSVKLFLHDPRLDIFYGNSEPSKCNCVKLTAIISAGIELSNLVLIMKLMC